MKEAHCSKVAELESQALWVRQQILSMIFRARRGHIGGSLSVTEILVYLYGSELFRVAPSLVNDDKRDRIIFSKGHCCEALYSVLAYHNFISRDLLLTYGQDGTSLGGHPDQRIPGVEILGGSLGHGLGIGTGMALAARFANNDHLTIVILGDGECYEGSIWEAAGFAAHHSLNRLIVIVDRNREITLDSTETCNKLEPFAAKWQSFGWDVQECNGHDFSSIESACLSLRARSSHKPLAIIANTIKGRGISFMEGQVGWHHSVPNAEQFARAKHDLEM